MCTFRFCVAINELMRQRYFALVVLFHVNGIVTSRMYPCYIRDLTAREVRERSAWGCQTYFLSLEKGDGMMCV